MPRFDRIIDFMLKQQGTKFSMKNDENVYLFTQKGSRPLNQLMKLDEIEEILKEVLPVELEEKYIDDCFLAFPLPSDKGNFAIQVERDPESLSVSVLAVEGKVETVAEPRRRVVEPEDEDEPVLVEKVEKPAPPTPQPDAAPERTAAEEEARSPEVAPPSVEPVAEEGSTLETRPRVARPQLARVPGQYLENLFRYVLKTGATDVHLSAANQPFARVDGQLMRLTEFDAVTNDQLQEVLWQIVPETNRKEFNEHGQTDFAQDAGEKLRLRCNLYQDNDGIGAVLRLVPRTIRGPKELSIPQVLTDLCRVRQGLVLITGPARSGKSTSIAALLDSVNRERECHILTIENSIEFVIHSDKALVNQRQIGVHVGSYTAALNAAFLEDPDVCFVDDLTDMNTFETVLKMAQTGRLVIGSLFTTTTAQAVAFIVEQFPEERKPAICASLASTIVGIASQVLCRKEGGGQIPAFEILLFTPPVCDVVRAQRFNDLPSMIRAGKKDKMVSLNASLVQLVRQSVISPAEAYEQSVDVSLLLEQFKELGIRFDPRAPVDG